MNHAEPAMNEFPLLETSSENIVLFHPHIPAKAAEAVTEVLKTRWIGQGESNSSKEPLVFDLGTDAQRLLSDREPMPYTFPTSWRA